LKWNCERWQVARFLITTWGNPLSVGFCQIPIHIPIPIPISIPYSVRFDSVMDGMDPDLWDRMWLRICHCSNAWHKYKSRCCLIEIIFFRAGEIELPQSNVECRTDRSESRVHNGAIMLLIMEPLPHGLFGLALRSFPSQLNGYQCEWISSICS